MSAPFSNAQAVVECDGQIDWMGDGVLCQFVTVILFDDDVVVDEPAVGELTAAQARALAFELLACAEHAERLTRHHDEDEGVDR